MAESGYEGGDRRNAGAEATLLMAMKQAYQNEMTPLSARLNSLSLVPVEDLLSFFAEISGGWP
jgi:hypothetical protein